MENQTLENSVDIESSELKNSPIDNSETGTTHNNETGTTNNYYVAKNQDSPHKAQLDRIEQKLDFLIQRVFK